MGEEGEMTEINLCIFEYGCVQWHGKYYSTRFVKKVFQKIGGGLTMINCLNVSVLFLSAKKCKRWRSRDS